MTYSRMAALGSYVPEKSVTNQDLVAPMAHPEYINIEKITGIQARRVYGPGDDTATMAIKAAQDAIANHGGAPEDLDIIINASIMRTADGTKFTYEPSLSLLIRNTVGATRAIHFDISNACAGMMTGVLILDRMIKAGIVRRGLVVSGEQITLIAETAVQEIVDKYDLQFASLTIGDAAAAVILEASDPAADDPAVDGIEFVDLVMAAESAEHCLGMPSDQGPRIALYTDNKKMHNEARFMLLFDWLKDRLAEQGRKIGDFNFDRSIHHQVALMAVAMTQHMWQREFGEQPAPEVNALEYLGNTASTSHFVVLHEKLKSGEVTPGDKLAMIPAASGVVTGLLAVSTNGTKFGRAAAGASDAHATPDTAAANNVTVGGAA